MRPLPKDVDAAGVWILIGPHPDFSVSGELVGDGGNAGVVGNVPGGRRLLCPVLPSPPLHPHFLLWIPLPEMDFWSIQVTLTGNHTRKAKTPKSKLVC